MHLLFDEAKQKWVIYRRIIPEFSERMIANDSDRERPPIDRYNRSYAYAESDDLREWKQHRFILAMDADDPADTELYQFGCHKFGATYVGYASIFYLRHPQPIDIHLATSRDGIRFTRVCRGTPFIPHGPLGYYDFMAMACSQPRPIVVNDTIYIYYAALNFPHDVDESASAHYSGGVALGDSEARPVRLAGNRHARCRTVPHPHEATNHFASAPLPERRDLGERFHPRRSADSRLATHRRLHGRRVSRNPRRRSRPSRPLVGQRRLGQAPGAGDSAQVPHDARPSACDDHERSRAEAGACGSRVSIRPCGRFRAQAELTRGIGFQPVMPKEK